MPDAGMVKTAAFRGLVKVLVPDAYEGDRRSKILAVPSVEQVPTTSGWCGEKRAW